MKKLMRGVIEGVEQTDWDEKLIEFLDGPRARTALFIFTLLAALLFFSQVLLRRLVE